MYSHQFYMQCKQSDLWLLIQYQHPQNMYNYDIIHVSEVIQKDKMYTGEMIDIRYGNSVLKAVVFIISENKSFLEAELRNISRQSSFNLTKNSLKGEERSPKPVETYTRRNKLTKSPNEYKPNPSMSQLPSSASSNNTNESTNSNVDKHITVVIPPKTFDQGTQTDITLSTLENGAIKAKKIVQQLECMIKENQQLRNDNQQIEQIERMLNDLLCEIKTTNHRHSTNTTTKEMQQKHPHIINSQMLTNNEPIVLIKKSSNLNTPQIDNNMAIETFDGNNENSNIPHSNCSPLSMISNESVSNSTPMNHQSASAGELNQTQSSCVSDVKHNRDEFENEQEIPIEITIGANGTKVPRLIVDRITESSYSHATRQLLSLLFSRDELATQSLTGKLPPTYIFDPKPAKNQLNTLIISDIVQFVSQKYGVTDAAVRSIISMKCKDQNKIYRQTMEKRRNVLHSTENGNKENDSDVKIAPENLTM